MFLFNAIINWLNLENGQNIFALRILHGARIGSVINFDFNPEQ